MRLPNMFGLLTASALLIGATSANALILEIDDFATGGIEVTVTDAGTPGVVSYNSAIDGEVGVFDLVVTTGLGAPNVGGPGEAEIDLTARATSDLEGTLQISLTDTNLTIDAVANGGTLVTSDLGINSVSNASATIESFIRIGASTVFELLATTTDIDLLETVRRTITDTDTFDLRTVITMVHGDKFSFASAQGNINVAPVPLPAALPLFLTALVGLGFVGRHRRRQAA